MTVRGWTVSASLAAGWLLAACGKPPPPRIDEGSLAGCYALARQDSPRVALGALMPDTLMMDTAVQSNDRGEPDSRYPRQLYIVSHRPGAGRTLQDLGDGTAAPWPPEWARTFAFTGWRFDPPDMVAADLHQNMGASWKLRLRAAGDSLIGIAAYSDDTPATRTIVVAAHRVPCGVRTSDVQGANATPAAR